MGAGASKPEGASKHVFSSNTPIQFSQELVDSLQASSETDSTRAKTLELHIAQRVASELAALQKKEDDALTSLRLDLSSSSSSSTITTTKPTPQPRLLDLASPAPPGDVLARDETRHNQSSAQVFAELEKLRQGLEARKKVRDMPREVERAREELVGCLRLNDRRPLDCWREVELFKGVVRKMELEFVGSVL